MEKKVYLYSTCLGSALMGRTIMNTVWLLKQAGFEVIYKKNQTCCGQPSYNSGYFQESKKVALYNADLFNKDYPVLVPSGSCAGMMMHDYLELFDENDEDYQKIKKFSNRVFELGEFLDKYLKIDDLGNPIKVTWHGNCHALRVAKSVSFSKSLIKKLKNVELITLPYEEECCGFGGTFSVKEPEVSNAMVLEKIKHIKETECKYIIIGDGGCMMNIDGALKRNKIDIKVIHLYDFLAKRMKGEVI
ncbi:(Fe-S)-binding protein [Campylobacter ureolyticus]|uniref:(Fe-S)-binding protein n=1 Tax=Campylobacter ureolyticus TaxID=827 RepID=UPI0022B4CFC7|nr:(Fe-S)-binding protein [Campylobacter ureolyticus]MCZ6186962.1 (Fe-S)-binding protein [Campylobacter ureolyticus]